MSILLSLGKKIGKWQPRLYLMHWRFSPRVAPLPGDIVAQLQSDVNHRVADIVLCEHWKDKYESMVFSVVDDDDENHEKSVIHELWHATMQPRERDLSKLLEEVKQANPPLGRLLEDLIYSMIEESCNLAARILMDADSGRWASMAPAPMTVIEEPAVPNEQV